MNTKSVSKFVLLSLIGVFLFFVPVQNSKVPVVLITDTIKALLGPALGLVVVISCTLLVLGLIGARVFHIKALEQYYSGDPVIKMGFFLASAILVWMVTLNVDLPFIQHPKILTLASTVFFTIALAGTLVIFIIRSGIVEFVSVLCEPIMRPIFKLPGEAAINMISSFVSSASVGVYFTEQYYTQKAYTTRQACAVVTNFSVISVGYIGVLASIAGIEEMYGVLLIASFVLVLVMGAIMIRIPPLSMIPDTCIDGSAPVVTTRKMSFSERFRLAVEQGAARSEQFTAKAFLQNFLQAMKFAQKTIGVMVPTVMLVLTLVYYTPLFQWIGAPLAPVLGLFGVPDAALAAPSVLIGIVEISLPSILVSGTGACAAAAFFVVQLSIVQIIFFSECGNAILSSKIPLGAGKLVLIFLMRTAIAIPLVALLTNLIY